jgi:hypothetical protein
MAPNRSDTRGISPVLGFQFWSMLEWLGLNGTQPKWYQGNLPGLGLPILAEVEITGPQWCPTKVRLGTVWFIVRVLIPCFSDMKQLRVSTFLRHDVSLSHVLPRFHSVPIHTWVEWGKWGEWIFPSSKQAAFAGIRTHGLPILNPTPSCLPLDQAAPSTVGNLPWFVMLCGTNLEHPDKTYKVKQGYLLYHLMNQSNRDLNPRPQRWWALSSYLLCQSDSWRNYLIIFQAFQNLPSLLQIDVAINQVTYYTFFMP